MITLPTVTQSDILFLIAVATVLVGIVAWFRRKIRPVFRGLRYMTQDWNGVPPRPGVPGREGVMERIAKIEKDSAEALYHSKPNGGNSAYDHLSNKIDETKVEMQNDVGQVQSDVSALINTLAEHTNNLISLGDRMDASEHDRKNIHRDIAIFKFGKTENHHD